MIVFRDHKQENKRKEMFHHCYMFAIIYDSSSTNWELRNSVLPMLFQSGNVKDVSTSNSTEWPSIQTCQLHQYTVVDIRELRNSVLPMLFHGWKCERRAFDFYPYYHNSKMLFSCWLAFNLNIYIINIYMEMIIFLMKDHMTHDTILGNARQ